MKKYLYLLGIVMIVLILVSIPYSYGMESELNSNQLYEYITENHIQNIKKICSNDFCDYLRGLNIEDSFSLFVQKYQDYLTETYSEERALEVVLKGFPITKIEILN